MRTLAPSASMVRVGWLIRGGRRGTDEHQRQARSDTHYRRQPALFASVIPLTERPAAARHHVPHRIANHFQEIET